MRIKKRKTPKKKTLMRHTTRRMAERMDMDITQNDISIMVRQIQQGQAELIDRQSNRVTRWWVKLHDKEFPVVYDTDRKTIITVLKAEWVTPPKVWKCACGWAGRKHEMLFNPSGCHICPSCGGSGGLI